MPCCRGHVGMGIAHVTAPVEEMPSDGDLEVGIAQMVMSQSPCLPKSLPPCSLVEEQMGGGCP